jgi:MFS family permease
MSEDEQDIHPPTPSERRTILGYATPMVFLIYFVSPPVGLFVVPLSFLLKNKLHLSAYGIAQFTLWAGVPAYLSFLFGIARDYWNPFGRGDRGFLLLFGTLSAGLFAFFAFAGASWGMLFANAFTFTVCYLFLWSAWNGLASTVGQRRGMSGEMSAVWNFAGTAGSIAGFKLGGLLSDRLEGVSGSEAVRILYSLAAAILALIAVMSLWKPRAVFDGLAREPRHDLWADVKRLVRHRPIYPALIIWCLWNFAPGGQTVLQFHLADALHGTDDQWGDYNAIFYASSLPAFLIFGLLSTRLSLEKLLWIGAIMGVPQQMPLLLAHSAEGVLYAAVAVGLIGGIATAAYMDLLIRACPKGLEGTLMMMAWSLYAISTNFGNLWGTSLYEHHGYAVCVWATTAVYALILPAILLIPRSLIATRDA